MEIKKYSDALFSVLRDKAGAMAVKYYHTHCGVCHLFLATFSFLNKNKEDAKYEKIYMTLKDILNKYGVSGPTFEKSFLTFFPKGDSADRSNKISATGEYTRIVDALGRNAINEKRTMDIPDLIVEMFADKSYDIYTVFSDIIGSDNKTDDMYNEIVKAFRKIVVPEIQDLEEMHELTNINKWVSEHKNVVIDAEEPLRKIEMALSGRSIRNAILTGPAGVGKTCYVEELARRIVEGNVPNDFKDKIIYQLDTATLVSGTRYRGDLEQKIVNILDVVKKHPNVILFIDEIHTFLKGGSSEGSDGCGQLIKPYITRGEIQIIGCTTNEEYTKYIKEDKAFERRFHEIKINEPNKEALKKILVGILPTETEYFNKEIQNELVDTVIDLSSKYTLDQANPAKSINMLELACAYSKVFEEKKQVVDLADVIHSVKLKYNIYISENKLTDTKKGLFEVLLGQDDALNQVLRDLKIVDRNLVDLQKPLMSILLAGPTGTGKTESARIIAKNYFGSEDNLIKINMGEYSSEMDVSKLVGASSGYVGYEDEPELIKKVRQKPNSVVLFDEIEKAHRSVQKILLNILDEGTMKDNKGNEVSFRNCIIIFTTNLGCTKDTGKAQGIGFVKTKEGYGTAEIQKAIENYFSPEFLGRLDDIIYYKELPQSIIKTLITRYLDEYKAQCNDLKVEFSEDDIKEIIKDADINTRGARGVRKAVKKQIIKVEAREADTKETTDTDISTIF